MTSDGVSLFAYDLDTGASYQFEQDTDAYPNVYTVEVPATVSNVSVYRSLSEVDEKPVGGDDGNVYNCWDATVSRQTTASHSAMTKLFQQLRMFRSRSLHSHFQEFTLITQRHTILMFISTVGQRAGLGNAAAHMK